MFFNRDNPSSWSGRASLLFFLATAGATGLAIGGCSSGGPSPGDHGDLGPDGGAPALHASTSTCTLGGPTQLSFSTTLDCGAHGGACALDRLTLDATSELDQATGGATTSWTIHGSSGPLMRETLRSRGGVTSGDLAFGAELHGPTHATFVKDGQNITWAIDGRTARLSGGGRHPGMLAFDDGGEQPEIAIRPETREAIASLLDQARAEASISCAGSLALPSFQLALPASTHETEPARLARPGDGVAPVAAQHPKAMALQAVGTVGGVNPTPLIPLIGGTPAEVAGVYPDFDGSSQMNNFTSWNTPVCQACQSSCTSNYLCDVTPGCLQTCQGGCFIPGAGCAQNTCPIQNGYGTCDGNQTCCGSVCCGPGTVCGDSTLGVCCPAADPVACGDQTQQWCYAPGTTCCSNADACPAGTQCTNVTGTTATCCPPAQTATSGACCERDTCGGQCCDTGVCVNGACCEGKEVNGQCCGLADAVCGGNCCAGSCTASGACCATGNTVCGSACCGSGDVCLDAATSTCGVPVAPTLTLWTSTGVALGHTGGPAIPVIAGLQYKLTGQAWVPGTVDVNPDNAFVTNPLAKPIASGGADSSTFSTTVTFNLTTGDHILYAVEDVGARGLISSKLTVYVNHIQ
jgi:hypothetical protein